MELPVLGSSEAPASGVHLEEETTVGNYFVSNYPPYSFWTQDHVGEAHAALDRPPAPGTPLGVYLHIPFCRKRCHFCYSRFIRIRMRRKSSSISKLRSRS